MRWSWPAFAAAVATGCLEFVEPVQSSPPPEPASLRISVVVNRPADSVLVDAVFHPGRDSVAFRSVPETALRIGAEVVPARVDSLSPPLRRYRWQAPLSTTPSVLAITGPTVSGTSPATRSLGLPLIKRAGERIMEIDRATDLVIPLQVGPADSGAGVRSWSWSFRLVAQDGGGVSLNGVGSPPPALTLPAGVFELVTADSCLAFLDAIVSADAGYPPSPPLSADGYLVSGYAIVRLDWIVRLTAPTP